MKKVNAAEELRRHLTYIDSLEDVDRDAMLYAFLKRCWPSPRAQDQ